jgi:hypothetical protein
MEFATPVQNVSKVSIYNSQVVSVQPVTSGTVVYDNGDGIWREFVSEISPFTEVRKYEYTNSPVTMKKVRTIIKGDTNQTGCLSNIQIYTQGERYLKLQFPEGSPTHPAHPAGHACVAGACVTVLKAMLKCHNDDGTRRAWPLTAKHSLDGMSLVDYADMDKDSMTVIGELSKLANNVSLGRDFAAVHYRADGKDGIDLGEAYAITYLQDKAKEYHESNVGLFPGFLLERFDGSTVRIYHDRIYDLV